MSTHVSRVGEFRLIDLIKQKAHTTKDVILGIGDDTAVLGGFGPDWLLFTTDMISEGVHFSRGINPEGIGHKALASNISDIAAMGGVPTFAVISLGIPASAEVDFVKNIYKGINSLAQKFQVGIVGGDIIKSNKVIINIALLGKVKKKELVTRCGAREGDIIFTTGALGRSPKTGKHLRFTPRVKEAQFLVKKFKPTAMIDISDGLAADLGHILEQSCAGAVIYEDRIPKTARAILKNALYDGEDFELLFTLASGKARYLKKQRCFKFYPIGEIVKESEGLRLIDHRGRRKKIASKGFTHF